MSLKTKKLFKFTDKRRKMTPEELLISVGAVDMEKKQGYPDSVFINEKDFKKMEKVAEKIVRKNYKGLSDTKVLSTVAFNMLNFAPRTSEKVKPGYIMVDLKSIRKR